MLLLAMLRLLVTFVIQFLPLQSEHDLLRQLQKWLPMYYVQNQRIYIISGDIMSPQNAILHGSTNILHLYPIVNSHP